MNQDDELKEELAISLKLGNQRCNGAVVEALQAIADGQWEQAKGAIEAAIASLESYSDPSPSSDELKAALNLAMKAVENQDEEAGREALEAASGLMQSVSARNAVKRLSLAGEINPVGAEYEITLIDPGDGNGLTWPAPVLARDCQKFNNLTSFTNHERLDVMMARPGGRTIDDICGVVYGVKWNGGAVTGKWRATAPKGPWVAAMIDQIIRDRDGGLPVPDVGVSLDLAVYYDQNSRVTEITEAYSADIVFNAARGPRFGEAFARVANAVRDKENQPGNSPPEPQAIQPGKVEAMNQTAAATTPPEVKVNETEARAALANQEAEHAMAARETAEKEALVKQQEEESRQAKEAYDATQTWLGAVKQASLQAILSSSGLPQPSMERLSGGAYDTPEDLQKAIETERQYLAKLTESRVVDIGGMAPRSAQISAGRTSLEQLETAVEALLAGIRPADGVAPLSGIREMYHILSGDYEMTGLFRSERVYLANVNSSTMAGIVADALNKVLIKEFAEYPRWWEPIVDIQDFTTLQTVRWMSLGGIGELPTVAEGSAYTELTWDDQTESSIFVKKGGYLGITLEAIDKDETNKFRAAPKALGQAAWLTLSKSVASIFSDNSGVGPTMSDNLALFHSTHGNLGSSPLSFTSWEATRIAMRKQTELNSGERLGALTAPRYLLTPSDMETTALQILMSAREPGHGNNDENPWTSGSDRDARLAFARERVIVIDFWNDTNNWASVADPRLYPTIGIAFRYGRQPEIFSVASPTAGLMFTNDVMPVKVRFFFAVGPMDWRGLYKHNVS